MKRNALSLAHQNAKHEFDLERKLLVVAQHTVSRVM